MDQRKARRRKKEEEIGEVMATVYKRVHASGNVVWYANFIVRGRRYRQKLEAQNKAQAKQMAHKLEEDVINRRFELVGKYHSVTLEKLAEKYIDYVKELKRSWSRDVVSLKNILSMVIDSKPLGKFTIMEITTFHIQKYQIRRKRELDEKFEAKGIPKEDRNYATVNRELACLRHMFYLALEWELVEKNPVASRSIKFFPEKRRDRLLSKEELGELLSACEGRLRNIVLVALNTGMRMGEIFNLRWDQVDLFNRKILLTRTKTNQNRSIPINDFLFGVLESIERRNEYVFSHASGKPLGSVKISFKKVLRKAEIDDFRLHDLRHQFASYLAMGRIDETTIAELLGHSKKTMTSRYSHSSWERKVEAVEIIGDLCHDLVTKGTGGEKAVHHNMLKIG
jgi:integrase